MLKIKLLVLILYKTANFGKLMEQKVLHLLNITNKTVNKKEQK